MQSIPNAVSVAIFSGPEALLIQRARAPYQGYWTLPGGRMERTEVPEDTARREIREELGLDLGALLPVTISSGGGGFVLAVFAARLKAGRPKPSNEIADWQWTHPDSLVVAPVTPGLARILLQAADVLNGG